MVRLKVQIFVIVNILSFKQTFQNSIKLFHVTSLPAFPKEIKLHSVISL